MAKNPTQKIPRANKGIAISAPETPCPKWQIVPSMYLAGKAALDESEFLEVSLERKWGRGRLRLLVSTELREKLDRQRYLTKQAIWEGTLEDVRREGKRMATAWKVLDKAATEAGFLPIEPSVWETVLSNGFVAAIVREPELANKVVTEGRKMIVFTLDEVARMIEAFPEVCAVKEVFPGAEIRESASIVKDPFQASIDPNSIDAGITDVKPNIDGIDGFVEDIGDDIPF